MFYSSSKERIRVSTSHQQLPQAILLQRIRGRTQHRFTSFSTALALAASTVSIGCAGPSERPRTAADSAFKVALLTPGPVSDQSWNAGAYQGLLRIRDSLGARISNIETKTPAEFDENFRQYGSQGYTLVFGHGFEFQDAARRVAPEFPHTTFITTSGSTSGPNLAGMTFGFADASYLAGLLAGAMTRSNIVGVIGGAQLPPVVESFGASSAAPGTPARPSKSRPRTSEIGMT